MIADGRPRQARAFLEHLLLYQPDPFHTALHHAGHAATELLDHPDTTALVHQVAIRLVRHLPVLEAQQTLKPLVPIHPRVLPPLIARLTDDVGSVRAAAAEALTGSSDPRAVDGLLARLTEDADFVRAAAVDALAGSSDPRAVDGLLARLTDDDSRVRRAAVRALKGSVDPRAVDGLLARLTDDADSVRTAAAEALTGSANPHAADGLLARLTDDAYSVRVAAVRALKGSVDPRAADGLLARLTDDSYYVRHLAVEALTGSADKASSAVEQLIQGRFVAGRLAWGSLAERVAPTVPLVARAEWTARVLTAAASRATESPAARK